MRDRDEMIGNSDQAKAQRPSEPLFDLNIARSKPVLFLHIPKTAGTSFLLMLRNTFGDNRVQRIEKVDDRIGEVVHHIVDGELSGISCLAGHLSIHLFHDTLDRFHPFTVLREPVARVLSLYRFMRNHDPTVPRRLGLRPDFSLEDFLNWGHPELYNQVNNGMVRMLCGDSRLVYPGAPLVWDIGGNVEALQHAIINLEQIDFGLTEELPTTLALARDRWAVPYRLDEYRENTSTVGATSVETALIHRIIALNTADLALYHQARAIFHARSPRPLLDAAPQSGRNPLSVFAPSMNREAAIGDIPGRVGFHEVESDGLAWLHADQRTVIHFVMDQDLVRVKLRVYRITLRYPVAEIAFSVNERQLPTLVSFAGDKWCWVETEHFETQDGINRLTIQAPQFIPVVELEPGSKDKRRLGIALSHMQIVP